MSEALAVLVDGRPGECVPVDDRGLQFGDGVFTTIAMKNGVPLLWERHLERLRADAARLGIDAPRREALEADLAALHVEKTDRATLKIVLTRGSSGRGYRAPARALARRIVTLWPRSTRAQCARDGAIVRLCRTRLAANPALAGIKHLNRLEQILARSEWDNEVDEGLMQDTDGAVIEGTATNVFAVRAGSLLTPTLNTCGVAGVMRGLILDRARAMALPNETRNLTLADIETADELFVTNSLIGLWPVRRLDAREYPIGPITRALQRAIDDDHDGN